MFVLIALLLFAQTAPSNAAPPGSNGQAICHYEPTTGQYELRLVSRDQVEDRLAQGDIQPTNGICITPTTTSTQPTQTPQPTPQPATPTVILKVPPTDTPQPTETPQPTPQPDTPTPITDTPPTEEIPPTPSTPRGMPPTGGDGCAYFMTCENMP